MAAALFSWFLTAASPRRSASALEIASGPVRGPEATALEGLQGWEAVPLTPPTSTAANATAGAAGPAPLRPITVAGGPTDAFQGSGAATPRTSPVAPAGMGTLVAMLTRVMAEGGAAEAPGLALALLQSSTASFDGVLVGWAPQSSALERAQARAALGLELRQTIRSGAPGAGATLEWLAIPAGTVVEEALLRLANQPGVLFAERNWILARETVSNDPSVSNGSLWGLYGEQSSPANGFGSQAAEAWARGFTGSASVVVGLIDEGVQNTHPDLAANFGVNPGEIAANGLDDDNNGYVDDIYGWDFYNNNASIYDGSEDDHGTHVAGTIGAVGNNGLGVAGVNWDVSLLSAKFLGSDGGSLADAIRAVDYFTDLKLRHGLNLVATNNSWGGGGYSQGLYDAIARAANAGIFFVAAAGNSSSSTPSYPAAYDLPNVIAVASIDSNGALSSFSNYGSSWVDLGAPGGGILSTLPNGTYGAYSGTSMATPHVTGALALLRAAQPTATMAQLKQALLESVVATPSLAGTTITGGRLDVNGAISRLEQLLSPPDPSTPTYGVSAPSSLNEGSSLHFTIHTTNVPEGTLLYWQITGSGISSADFLNLSALEGSLAVDANGAALLQATLAADLTQEGNETLLLDLFTDPERTAKVAGASVVVNDSSRPTGVVAWGSTASDSIQGGSGDDRLAGVMATGTTAAAMGAGQIDQLTGLEGADVFVLGDKRGVFYNDRIASSLGSGDYAMIRDFRRGVDKLQLAAGFSYLYTASRNSVSLYWDVNNNGRLNSSGSSRDELIAVLSGITSLSGSDLIGV